MILQADWIPHGSLWKADYLTNVRPIVPKSLTVHRVLGGDYGLAITPLTDGGEGSSPRVASMVKLMAYVLPSRK